jgi:tRNA nucleotidyltransferase (CCA-adding enzyme)
MSEQSQAVILTHEHTDFDALASLLAAALLFPDALPVLPQRLNRNVAEFVTLYRNQFPLRERRELERRPIDRLILVDTRTANLPRGVHEATSYWIIDHHTQESETPAPPGGQGGEVQLWSEPVGANTTLLVEQLIEQSVTLTPVQATVLALGIHEDTGSLTYAGTTHRDARALAWLMEPTQGVNLGEVQHYLRHPLSPEQRQLLETLVRQSEFLTVHGHTVAVALAEAPGFSGELSTLAHRLREVHEADAIFLVVGLGDVVQVVARSVTDAIDVGAVARTLGGGGHPRAAAAPVRDGTVQSVRAQIAQLLHAHSQPAVTVRHIMTSGRPQMVRPDLPLAEAAALMRRYGHEGYPVVERTPDGQEQLLGVLTRREADRALNHGLGDRPVRRFMQSGQVAVRPGDAVATLRKTMIESGWGQIPVVDERGQIIGIVTRTDLIKLWDETTPPARHAEEIARRLDAVLRAEQVTLLRFIGQEVDRLEFAVYVVGGFVRDLLLDEATEEIKTHGVAARRQSFDLDIVIEGDAIAFAHGLQARYGGRVVAHRRFGTAKWLLADPDHPIRLAETIGLSANTLPPHLDFVTARTEFYTAPTVLPTVELSNIKLDLHRRDFTINTLAFSLNPERWGELLDFYGGLRDLRQGIVRVLHSLSFVDDPTRILRAVRYEQRFGFQIEARTLELLQDATELLDRITPARLRHELERILLEAAPEKALRRLEALGVLAHIHPALTVDDWVMAQFGRLRRALAEPGVDQRLAETSHERLYWGLLTLRLPAAAHEALQERLGLRTETQRLMAGLHQLQTQAAQLADPALRPSQVVARLDEIDEVAQALFLLTEPAPAVAERLRRYTTEWQPCHAHLTGSDLQALGIPPGPVYRQILTGLRAARLDGLLHTPEDERAWVAAFLAQPQRS